MSPYQEIDHTADWALQVWAPTVEALFVDAARGMYALAGAEGEPAAPPTHRRIEIEAGDYESLLVAWLHELLYYTETEGDVFYRFHVAALSPTRLQAEAYGSRDGSLDKMIKAVTYHNLTIRRTPNGFETTIVFDV